MDTLYVFTGLGADKRIFSKLDLSDLHVQFIEWLSPTFEESLESYILRLATHNQIPKHGALVLGLSFGGICVSELAKFYDFGKTILLSSAKTSDELPQILGISNYISLEKIMKKNTLTKIPTKIVSWLFGLKNQQEKELFFSMLDATDTDFMDWAVVQFTHWQNKHIPVNCLHIHGDKDRLIPIQNVDYTVRIKGGGHFMVYSNAAEISYIIRNFLK